MRTLRISQIKLVPGHGEDELRRIAVRILKIKPEEIIDLKICRKSVDARDKRAVKLIYTVDVTVSGVPAVPRGVSPVKEEAGRMLRPSRIPEKRPLVVGLGPAGLFAALTLARFGMAPIVRERGRPVGERSVHVNRFWNGGELNPDSNVLFGEGGAGAFSDGKLTTGTGDPRLGEVRDVLIAAGAPEEIRYMAKPHIGTDKLCGVVERIRNDIIDMGGEVHFSNRLERLEVENSHVVGAKILREGGDIWELDTEDVILAVGHSARDTFEMLVRLGVPMSQKAFSIGARIEHVQAVINNAQYGEFAGSLGAADYKLSAHLPNGRGVYTFCMCPGGQVVAAASEEGGVVTNGMSRYARDGKNANSALLVSVGPGDFGTGPLAGVEFQRRWERLAFEAGGGDYRAPAQLVGDFLKKKASVCGGTVEPSYLPGVSWGNLDDCLPNYVTDSMRAALTVFDRRVKGFACSDAVLTGVETRSSSPVRIDRGSDCQSEIRGLYPCGEAGGIMSAAVDGMRCAENMTKCEGI